MTITPVSVASRSLSPTALGHAEVCGRRLQFYLDPEITRVGVGLAQARGSALHWAFEAFNKGRLFYGDDKVGGLVGTTSVLRERVSAIAVGYLMEMTAREDFKLKPDETDQDIVTACYQLELMVYHWAEMPSRLWWGQGISVVAAEQLVVADFGLSDYYMKGVIDLVVDIPDVGPVGVDYKTTTRQWSKAKLEGDPRLLPQAPLYAEAWYRITGQEMNHFAYDVYKLDGTFNRVWVDVSAPIRERFVTRWQEVALDHRVHEINDLVMPTNPGHHLCSENWCDFWHLCPMGAELESIRGRKGKP